MAKAKSKNLETKVKKREKVKVNPFERRFGRDKHHVLNRRKKDEEGRKGATEVGKPGIARSRAIQKRKETLLKEYKVKDKDNVLMDRRIGRDLPEEDRMVARFAAERVKSSGKKNKFNLEDEDGDTLTHMGKAISEIEQFEDPRSDDEDDLANDRVDKKGKKLGADFVDEAHFGGFMSRADADFAEGKGNTRKDWIENMIAESKKKKFEKQKLLAESAEATQELDKMWKDNWSRIQEGGEIISKAENEELKAANGPDDDYSRMLRELTFEKGGKVATERVKTAEEVLKEDREKLQQMEKERMLRMKGEFEVEQDEESDEDGDSDDEDDDEDDDGEEEEEEGDEGSDDDEDEGASDLEESEDEEPEDEPPKKKTKKTTTKPTPKPGLTAKEKLEMIEAAAKEIPYTFTVPTTYEEWVGHVEGRSPSDHALVLQRMIKCNHPQFGQDNKEKLQGLFTFILQYIHDLASEADELEVISEVTPFLYDLAQFSPQPSAKAVLSVLLEKHEEYVKRPRAFIDLDSIVFLKVAHLLFPTSDYRHPVVTPTLHWMSQVLSSVRYSSRAALASGLLTACIFVEALTLSKRFSPELLNFLTGIVFMSFPKDKSKVTHTFVSPFKVVGPEAELLASHLSKKKAPQDKGLKWSDVKDCESDLDPKFASSALNVTFQLLDKLVDLWSDQPSFEEMFAPLSTFLAQLSEGKIHAQLFKAKSDLEAKLDRLKGKAGKKAILKPRKKQKILRLYEPEIDMNFDPFHAKKDVGVSKDKAEMNKLIHKLKREKKAAKKDLRADSAFLAGVKAKEAREKDLERQKKTKAILSGLGNQEGEVRKLQRKKSRMSK